MSFGGSSIIPGGLLVSDNTATGTDAATSAKTLATVNIPAGIFLGSPNGGAAVRVLAWGGFAGNANGKTVTVTVGGTTVASDNGAHNGGGWACEVLLLNPVDSGAIFFTSHMWQLRATVRNQNTISPTLSAAIPVVVIGQNAVATANDITYKGMIIELLPWYAVE